MKKSLLIYFVLIVISFYSCQDENKIPTILKGQVLNYYTENPIEDYDLELIEQRIVLYGIIGMTIDTIITDENGSFSYSFFHDDAFDYKLAAGTNNYEFESFMMESIIVESENIFTIIVKPN